MVKIRVRVGVRVRVKVNPVVHVCTLKGVVPVPTCVGNLQV